MDQYGQAVEAVALAAKMTLENGGEAYRAEQTVERMAQGFGFKRIEVIAFPTGVTMTLLTESGACVTRIVRVSHRSIDLKKLDACNAISRMAAAGLINSEEAYSRLQEEDGKPPYRFMIRLLACALSSGFFAVMLSGGAVEFLVSFLCGLGIQILLSLLERWKAPGILNGMVLALFTAVVALTAHRLYAPLAVGPVISGAIMPILPGLAMTNAIRDTIRGDLVSGGARCAEAVLCALTLGAGIGIVISMFGGV